MFNLLRHIIYAVDMCLIIYATELLSVCLTVISLLLLAIVLICSIWIWTSVKKFKLINSLRSNLVANNTTSSNCTVKPIQTYEDVTVAPSDSASVSVDTRKNVAYAMHTPGTRKNIAYSVHNPSLKTANFCQADI